MSKSIFGYNIFAFGDKGEECILFGRWRGKGKSKLIKLSFFRFNGGKFRHKLSLFEEYLSIYLFLRISFVHSN